MAKAKREQARMDFGCDDLPLFSGTPVPVEQAGPVRSSGRAKQSVMASCRVCLDTGTVVVAAGGEPRFCSCAAGQAARAAHKRAKEQGR